ncbi:MAG: hypothetical protein LBD48_09845, partial [Treponema sp.]|nr:hypothetical protein [Treponema sp.]
CLNIPTVHTIKPAGNSTSWTAPTSAKKQQNAEHFAKTCSITNRVIEQVQSVKYCLLIVYCLHVAELERNKPNP